MYAHDFSEFHEIELGADGRFGYKHLPLYWREPNRRPFLVKVDGKLAGLVLVKRGSELSGDETVWDVAEFFVVRRYRRRGIGTYVAHAVWRQVPGLWEVRVMESNHPRISSGRTPSQRSLGRRSFHVASKTVTNYGAYSQLSRSLARKATDETALDSQPNAAVPAKEEGFEQLP